MNTPLVPIRRADLVGANLDPHLLDELTDVITEQLDREVVTEVLDGAIGEMYSQQDVQEEGFAGVGRIQHQWLGRALLRAAEQQFILAAGGAEDVTP